MSLTIGAAPEHKTNTQLKVVSWRKTAEMPHDSEAFTQGFEVWDKNYFLESTGQYGRSDVRLVDRRTGKVTAKAPLDRQYFGEGVTRWREEILQLTWRENVIMRWNFSEKKGFTLKATLPWKGEAWGITHGDSSLWISDGSSSIFEVAPNTLKPQGTITVKLMGQEFDKLNELEFVEGRIFANVFMSSTVVMIHPRSGQIEGLMDLSTLVPKGLSAEAIANGLAWDSAKRRLYVTGKFWPKVYELKLE